MESETLFIQRLGKEAGIFLHKLVTKQIPLKFENYEKGSINYGKQLKVQAILRSQGLIDTEGFTIILNTAKIKKL